MLPTKFCEYVDGGRASCTKVSAHATLVYSVSPSAHCTGSLFGLCVHPPISDVMAPSPG